MNSLIPRSRINYWILGAVLSCYIGWSTITKGTQFGPYAALMAGLQYGLILYAVESILLLFKDTGKEFSKLQIILMGAIIVFICPAFAFLAASITAMK